MPECLFGLELGVAGVIVSIDTVSPPPMAEDKMRQQHTIDAENFHGRVNSRG